MFQNTRYNSEYIHIMVLDHSALILSCLPNGLLPLPPIPRAERSGERLSGPQWGAGGEAAKVCSVRRSAPRTVRQAQHTAHSY